VPGLKTFDIDFDPERSLPNECVWTVLNSEGGDQWVIPGIHYLNRVCYLMTKVPHNDLTIEFRIKRQASSLTKIGLAHQIKRLTNFQLFKF
jgi:hypothetical protein